MEMIFSIEKSGLPLYKALGEAIKEQIMTGKLQPGQVIPSVRELASSFGTSRSTILRSYELLSSQGYVQSTAKSGTRVSQTLPKFTDAVCFSEPVEIRGNDVSVSWTAFAERVAKCVDSTVDGDAVLDDGVIGTDDRNSSAHFFPISQWRKSVHHSLDKLAELSHEKTSDPFGYLPLREALQHYLHRSRAIECSASRIVALTSTEQALDMVCRLLIRPGDTVVLQETSFPSIRAVFVAHGAQIVTVGSDSEGLMIEQLSGIDSPKMLYLCPSHQAAVGQTTSLSRRNALLSWAQNNGAMIWEDDDDSEFRYGRAPVPSMHSMDRANSVIYSSSFRRTLGPYVQLAYMVLPATFVGKFAAVSGALLRRAPQIEDIVLARLIGAGTFEHHIFKTRVVFEKLRQNMIYALKIQLGSKVHISNEPTGSSLLLRFSDDWTCDQIESASENSKLLMTKTGKYYIDGADRKEYIVSFAQAGEPELSNRVDVFVRELSLCLNRSLCLSQQISFAPESAVDETFVAPVNTAAQFDVVNPHLHTK